MSNVHARSALQSRTPDDVANEQTAEQLALRIWAALVGKNALRAVSDLIDTLLDAHLLDDDDEETDDSWLDDHSKQENKRLAEAIADGLEKYPTIDAINNLPLPSDPDTDPDMKETAEQLCTVLVKCAVGATQIAKRFPRATLERMVKQDMRGRLEKDPKYSQHVRADVPGTDIRKYGDRNRTSSKGTFVKVAAYEHGGDLATLLTGGWVRVCEGSHRPRCMVLSIRFGAKNDPATLAAALQNYGALGKTERLCAQARNAARNRRRCD
jgi:hypothetical protein